MNILFEFIFKFVIKISTIIELNAVKLFKKLKKKFSQLLLFID